MKVSVQLDAAEIAALDTRRRGAVTLHIRLSGARCSRRRETGKQRSWAKHAVSVAPMTPRCAS
jgi:hypothetical protein